MQLNHPFLSVVGVSQMVALKPHGSISNPSKKLKGKVDEELSSVSTSCLCKLCSGKNQGASDSESGSSVNLSFQPQESMFLSSRSGVIARGTINQ